MQRKTDYKNEIFYYIPKKLLLYRCFKIQNQLSAVSFLTLQATDTN